MIASVVLSLGCWLAPALAAQTPNGPPSVLDVVPADAWAVLIVRDIADLDAKVARLGAAVPFPAAGVLTFVKGWLGVVSGLDEHGSLAVVLMPSKDATGGLLDNMALIVATKDRGDLLELLDPKPMSDGLTRVTLRGRETYAWAKGAFAVFGPTVDTVRAVVEATEPAARVLTPHQRRRFGATDVTLWINAAALLSSPTFSPHQSWIEARAGLDAAAQQRVRSVQISLRLKERGLCLEFYLDQQPAAASDQAPADPGEPARSLLIGLPDDSFIAVFGMAEGWATAALPALVDWSARVAAGFDLLDAGRIADVRSALRALATVIGNVAISASMLPEGPDGLVGVTAVVHTRINAQAVLDAMAAMVNLLKSGVVSDATLRKAMEGLTFSREAELVDGVVVSHLQLDLSAWDKLDPIVLERIVGREGALFRIGVVDDSRFVATLGGGAARFRTAVSAARKGTAPLASRAGLLRSATAVAPRRSFESYVAVDRFCRLIARVGRVLDRKMPVPNLPPVDAPVALTIRRIGPGAVQAELFVPLPLIEALAPMWLEWIGGKPSTTQ